MRPGGRPQQIGEEFEERFARLIGGVRVPGSGAGKFAKGDVNGRSIVYLCKATANHSFSFTEYMLHEARLVARATGADGCGLAVELGDGTIFVTHEFDGYVDVVDDQADAPIKRDAASAKKLAARTPPTMREGGWS